MLIKKYQKQFNESIASAENIYIMGHKNIDLDAFGASLGIYSYVKELNSKVAIIIDDEKLESGVETILKKSKEKINYKKSKEVINKITKKTLLIIVDTNQSDRVPNEDLLEKIDNIIVIDHHEFGKKTIKKGYSLISKESSSTCEIIVGLLSIENKTYEPLIMTALLSGIILDTGNFSINVKESTFSSAAYLIRNGADNKLAQTLLKQDISNYLKQEEFLKNVKVINKIAITSTNLNVYNRPEDLARMASRLMQFKGIKASIVIGKLTDNKVGISARSFDEFNVGELMEKFSGGGDKNNAATVVEKKSLKDIRRKIEKLINKL